MFSSFTDSAPEAAIMSLYVGINMLHVGMLA